MHEREQAIGKFMVLKKQIYELAVNAQSLVNEIQQETESFISERDFSRMDFKKVEISAKRLQDLQREFNDKVSKINFIRETYNIDEG